MQEVFSFSPSLPLFFFCLSPTLLGKVSLSLQPSSALKIQHGHKTLCEEILSACLLKILHCILSETWVSLSFSG